MTLRLPEEVRERSLSYAYEVFDRRKWEQVPAGERGSVFDELVADEEFNGPLRPYLSPAQMRVWLKDTVAKEYPRALEGIGSTARFTPRRYPGPEAIAHAALGCDWHVVPGSTEHKPMRCLVAGPSGETVTLLWGSHRGLRDLHWAASGICAASGEGSVVIALTRPNMTPPAKEEWSRAQALCDLIGVGLHSVMYAPRVLSDPTTGTNGVRSRDGA